MKKLLLPLVFGALFTTGCTTMVAKDYPAYLDNNQGSVSVPQMNKVATYSITDRTMAHKFKVKSFMAGAANSWIVEIGKMLDMSLKTADYDTAFSAQNQDLTVSFDLENYEFKNFQTYLTLKVSVSEGGKELYTREYSTVGKNQSGQVIMGGAFAMKNAVQQSTKYAIDDILNQLLNDLKQKNIAVTGFVPDFS